MPPRPAVGEARSRAYEANNRPMQTSSIKLPGVNHLDGEALISDVIAPFRGVQLVGCAREPTGALVVTLQGASKRALSEAMKRLGEIFIVPRPPAVAAPPLPRKETVLHFRAHAKQSLDAMLAKSGTDYQGFAMRLSQFCGANLRWEHDHLCSYGDDVEMVAFVQEVIDDALADRQFGLQLLTGFSDVRVASPAMQPALAALAMVDPAMVAPVMPAAMAAFAGTKKGQKNPGEVDITSIARELIGKNGSVIRFLQREYGVKAVTIASREGTALRVTGPSRDAVDVFVHAIEEFVADPATLVAMIAARRVEKVHIYCDTSNIARGVQHRNGSDDLNAHLDTAALMDLVTSLREPVRTVAVGSAPPRASAFWTKFGPAAEITVLDRVVRDGHRVEQSVDDVIHAAMLMDISSSWLKDRTMIVLSGDGNANHGRTNFPDVIHQALRNGWNVEVWSWQNSLSGVYNRFRDAYPTHFKVFTLDQFHEELLLKHQGK